MSVSIAPGVSTLAFWVAQQILDGKDVPKDLTVPFLRIDQGNLEATPRDQTEKGGVANVEYSLERRPEGHRGQEVTVASQVRSMVSDDVALRLDDGVEKASAPSVRWPVSTCASAPANAWGWSATTAPASRR